jgi:vancomycin aglycone glucosyltransferase
MRVLLSTIGSRGEVQPLVALAEQLRSHGVEVALCVPPDFRDWIGGLGFDVTTVGPDLRAATTGPAKPLSPEQLGRLAAESVADQFAAVRAAAKGCDLVVGATALQAAAPSVAELMGIPYVFAAFAPNVLPSAYLAPPSVPLDPQPGGGSSDIEEMWAENGARFNATFGPLLNRFRAAAGLGPVEDVRAHILTGGPWLAADPVLGPWPDPGRAVFQPGAWILPDERPLAPELAAFLDAGEPPVYFGFGSMRAPGDLGATLVTAARALGRRVIVARGWANLSPADDGPDCLAIGEVNQQALFRRVAAAVHHGGAGTTTAAALAGAPQVIVPQRYDQYYWAKRVHDLGVGSAHPPGVPTADSMVTALEPVLRPEVADRARALAPRVRLDGAATTARRLVERGGD